MSSAITSLIVRALIDLCCCSGLVRLYFVLNVIFENKFLFTIWTEIVEFQSYLTSLL